MTVLEKIMEGLDILRVAGATELQPGHDQIWVGYVDYSDELLAELEPLGWFYDDSVDSWSHFT